MPTLIYGNKSWVFNEKPKSKITKCEMKILRKIAVVTRMDKVRSEKISKDLNLKI